MFWVSFKDSSLNTFGKGVADYLHSAGEIVLLSNPVDGVPQVSDIEGDNSSNKGLLASTRFIFDCGVIWGMAYVFLRDEEYKKYNESKAIFKTEKNISKFIKQGLKYVSKHDYDLPKIYKNYKTIINLEMDGRLGGQKNPFNKGVSFSGVFLKEYYQISFK